VGAVLLLRGAAWGGTLRKQCAGEIMFRDIFARARWYLWDRPVLSVIGVGILSFGVAHAASTFLFPAHSFVISTTIPPTEPHSGESRISAGDIHKFSVQLIQAQVGDEMEPYAALSIEYSDGSHFYAQVDTHKLTGYAR
jgi:hypothetical protein